MQDPQVSRKSSSIIFKLMFPLIVLGLLAIYWQMNFPQSLKHIIPQKFQSHPVRDLSPMILQMQNTKSHHYKDPIIGQCEDLQVASNGIAYCVNSKSEIIQIRDNKVEKLGQAQKGISYGIRLSRDESKLYFVNSDLGLCEFDTKTKKIRSLVSEYNNTLLTALNSIQTHPKDKSILYITQSNPYIHMYLHTIDILLNNPLGRLYEFNIISGQLTLITDGLYFPNGIVFQVYKGEETVLVAETNRFRISRVYLSGEKRGVKEVAIDKLDVFLDNMKANEKGDIWVAGPSMRDELSHFADSHPWVRLIISRLPHQVFPYLVNAPYFGGVKISFSKQNENHSIDYYLWKSLPEFKFVTTLFERDNKLFMSSLKSTGVLVVENIDKVKGINEKAKKNASSGQDKDESL